jgi:hypothetical protein
MNKNKFLIPLLLALLALFLSCSGSTGPLTPVPNDKPPMPVISVDMGDLVDSQGNSLSGDYPLEQALTRPNQAVVPGTDMTIAELKCYFTKNLVVSNFPPAFFQKLVCPFFKAVVYAQSDTEILSWVTTMEDNGYDCPTAAQAAAGGWLKPLC